MCFLPKNFSRIVLITLHVLLFLSVIGGIILVSLKKPKNLNDDYYPDENPYKISELLGILIGLCVLSLTSLPILYYKKEYLIWTICILWIALFFTSFSYSVYLILMSRFETQTISCKQGTAYNLEMTKLFSKIDNSLCSDNCKCSDKIKIPQKNNLVTSNSSNIVNFQSCPDATITSVLKDVDTKNLIFSKKNIAFNLTEFSITWGKIETKFQCVGFCYDTPQEDKIYMFSDGSVEFIKEKKGCYPAVVKEMQDLCELLGFYIFSISCLLFFCIIMIFSWTCGLTDKNYEYQNLSMKVKSD